MSDSPSQAPEKKPRKTRKTAILEEIPADIQEKPKRATTRKKTVSEETQPTAAPKTRKKKDPELTETPAPKKTTRSKSQENTPTIEAEEAPKKRVSRKKKSDEYPSAAEIAVEASPAEKKPVRRKTKTSSSPEEEAETSAPRKTTRAATKKDVEPAAFSPENTPAEQDNPPVRIKRTSVKRISKPPGELGKTSDEHSPQVIERVSSLMDSTPMDGLPTKAAQHQQGNGERNNRSQKNRFQNNRNNGRQNNKNGRFNKNNRNNKKERYQQDHSPLVESGPPVDVNGMLEFAPKGYGFLRTQDNDFDQTIGGVYVAPEIIKKYALRHCQWIHGTAVNTNRGIQLREVISVNGTAPEEAKQLPHFEDLKAVNPNKRFSLETTPERYTTRVLDMMAPIGFGQRGLIVAPPRTGKTVLLQHIAEAIVEKYQGDVHLMILLIDERPEEVTEFKRSIQGAEVFASSNDGRVREHCRLAELCIERAKRLVETGKNVFILMDSITRLARAYNNASTGNGRTMSGGIDARALEMPRRLFAAARNTREAGSLTIIATALIETNSRMDDLIFQEFKGTGNMELVLNRRIAEQYIYPAVDILKSGTRREELILPELVLDRVNLIRRALAGHRPVEAMERLLYFLRKYPNNAQMLIDLKQRA